MCRSGIKERGNWVQGKKRGREAKKRHRKILSTLKEINFNLKFNKESIFWEKISFSSLELKMCTQFVSLPQLKCEREISWCCCTCLFPNFRLRVTKETKFLPLNLWWWLSLLHFSALENSRLDLFGNSPH